MRYVQQGGRQADRMVYRSKIDEQRQEARGTKKNDCDIELCIPLVLGFTLASLVCLIHYFPQHIVLFLTYETHS